jgi:hypothetical protein
MIPIEELKKNFLQTRINYWKEQPQNWVTKKMINELELIQIIVGKPNSPLSTKQSKDE